MHQNDTINLNQNFLSRNQYCIWFSDRCNYKCSYCCNNASPKAPKSEVESNPDALINLFNQVDPGVIMVSGGEPTLWQDFPILLDALPQHDWVILTNLTTIPSWFQHPNIKIFIPAYHEEFANSERFTAHLSQLQSMGKRAHAKIIVKPGQEYNQVSLWEKWNGMGTPASFVPLEYAFKFQRDFLKDIIYQFRTSALYNSRFFRRDTPINRLCSAGTKQAFQVNSNGKLVRCSAVFDACGNDQQSSIWTPLFNSERQYCSSETCFCEWHHWSQLANANDNTTWTRYVETGVWQAPSVEELCQFIIDMQWDLVGKNVENSKEIIFDLASFSDNLKDRVKLNQTQIKLDQHKAQEKRMQEELNLIRHDVQNQLQQAHQTLASTETELAIAKIELATLKNEIIAMQSSKFWKLRSNWIQFKQFIQLDKFLTKAKL